MKVIFTTLLLFILQPTFSQIIVNSKSNGVLEFKELEYGLAAVKNGVTEKLSGTPTGTHG